MALWEGFNVLAPVGESAGFLGSPRGPLGVLGGLSVPARTWHFERGSKCRLPREALGGLAPPWGTLGWSGKLWGPVGAAQVSLQQNGAFAVASSLRRQDVLELAGYALKVSRGAPGRSWGGPGDSPGRQGLPWKGPGGVLETPWEVRGGPYATLKSVVLMRLKTTDFV